MITVELDVFSGRPNPRWSLSDAEETAFVRRLQRSPMAIRKPGDSAGGLGYRGMVVTGDGPSVAALARVGAPASFRLSDQSAATQVDGRLALLASDGAELAVAPEVRDAAMGAIVGTAAGDPALCSCQQTAGGSSKSPTPTCTCFMTGSGAHALSYWNGPSHQSANNCYNYASNWRTDTFAQPGRGTGQMWTALTAPNVHAAALRDGYQLTCTDGGLMVALVIWPGVDYHWYRWTRASGHFQWTHKPGGTPARSTDDSGQPIGDPRTADRGSYTVWGGFLYSPGPKRETVK